ncbi:MAG: hypothetical protein L6V93_08410 [Clostridiales bacterium]|nr:MAG: hypothetical protein L6V93_08410 [Clostridiales bacterium]
MRLRKTVQKQASRFFRNMEYEFPNEGFEHVCDQFMLGSDIMSAPVLTKGRSKNARLNSPKASGRTKTEILFSRTEAKQKEFDAPIDTLLYFKK